MKAIIIGATSGIGRASAIRLIEEGWEVGIAGRRKEALVALQNEYGKNVHIVQMDVTRSDSIPALDTLLNEMGPPDLFFHVSGIGYQNRELDEEKELRIVQTNCEGMVRMVTHFLHYVRIHSEHYSATNKAHVAVVTSIAGTMGMGTAPAYSATKKMQQTYLTALSQLARMENIPVLFTDIRPGFVATDILNPDKHYPMMLTKEKAADEVMKALKSRKRIHVFDWKFRILAFFWRLIPRCIWERMTWVKN